MGAGAADGGPDHRLLARAGRHLRGGGHDGVLGGPVEVDHAGDPRVRVRPVGQRAREPLAPEGDGAHRRRQRRLEQEGGGGRHGVEQGELAEPGVLGEGEQVVGQQDGAAAAEREQQLEHGEVEADRRHRRGDPALVLVELLLRPAEHRGEGAVLDRHALRRAGGAAGEQHVGQVVRPDAQRRRQGLRRDERVPGRGVDHEPGAGVGEGAVGAARDVAVVDRHVRGAGGEDAEQGGDQPRVARQADADGVAAAHAGGPQPGRHAQRGAGEPAVGDLVVGRRDRRSSRVRGRCPEELLGQADNG